MPARTMKDLKQLYEAGVNIMHLLRVAECTEINTIDAIQAAYDLQSGSYVQGLRDPVAANFNRTYTGTIAAILDRYSPNSVMEAGAGEATTLVNVVLQMKEQPRHVLGFDISWSRLTVGREFSRENGVQPQLFMGDLNAIPIEDNAVDVVFTSHSIEPNRGCEASILKELFRVTKDYLVLLEPSNELGSELTRQHIERHRYCQNLHRHALDLGFTVVEHRLFDHTRNPCNQTTLLIIDKSMKKGFYAGSFLACPFCHHSLTFHKGSYFCPDCLMVYPVVAETACLLRSLGIIATRFIEGS